MTENIAFKFFGSRFAIALILFLALNMLLGFSAAVKKPILDLTAIQKSESEERQQGKWAFWLARAYLMKPRPPAIAVFGSSQMGSATYCADAHLLNRDLDCVTYRKLSTLEHELFLRTGSHIETANLALGGAMASDALMLERALFNAKHQPGIVIMSISPRDFIDNDLPSPQATDVYQYLKPYVDLHDLGTAIYPDIWSRLAWQADCFFAINRIRPLLSNQFQKLARHYISGPGSSSPTSKLSDIHAADKKSFLRAVLSAAGDAKPGEWIVSKSMPSLFLDNTREYKRRYRDPNPPAYICEKKFFEQFLQDMQSKNIPVLVIGMPSLPCNHALLPEAFWSSYRRWIGDTCSKHQAVFMDLSASPQFVQRDFLDTVHLNAAGGQKLFTIIANAICTDPQFVNPLCIAQ